MAGLRVPSSIRLTPVDVPLASLLLDPNNYRILSLTETDEKVPDPLVPHLQTETRAKLEGEALGKLQGSILSNGFLAVDRIVVRRLRDVEPEWHNHVLVIEGNRRTAALQGLRDQYVQGAQELPTELVAQMQAIPVLLVEGKPEDVDSFSQRLMGIRHVAKTKDWDGANSAKLVADFVKQGDSFREIEDLLGLRVGEAKRLYHRYKVYEQMRNHDRYGDVANPKKHYALLGEFLAPAARKWLGWDEHSARFTNPVNLENIYERIAPLNGGTPDIKNPTDARFAVKVLRDRTRRTLFERGEPLDHIPKFEPGTLSTLQRIRRSIGYLDNVDQTLGIRSAEAAALDELIEKASSLRDLSDL